MKLIDTNKQDWEDKEGYSKKIFLDEKDLNHPGALVQMIKVKAGERAESHHHKIQTEIFYFFDNTGFFIVNGEKVNLKAGDILVVEPNDKHTAESTGDNDFVYLAFKTDYSSDDLYWD